MKLFAPFVLPALALCAGLTPAAAQNKYSLPLPTPRISDAPGAVRVRGSVEAERETALLGANYRIVISATAKGGKDSNLGEISAQTCSAIFQIEALLSPPTADDSTGTDLSLRGELSELEGGALSLRYTLKTTTRVPNNSSTMAGEARPVIQYNWHKTGASGTVMMQPGRSYEVMQISGVVYSLSITPMETWTPAKEAAAPAPASAQKQAAAEPGEKKPATASRGGPTPEDRERYENFSDSAREKLRHAVREAYSQEQFRNSPVEERRAQINKLFDKIEAEDKARNK